MNASALRSSLESILPSSSILTKDIEVLAYANDASCYYLVPQAVVQPSTHEQIQKLFAWSKQYHIPLTFRAGGTSLSGQAITDGVLVDISKHWRTIEVAQDATLVRLQPGIVGGKVNEYLKKYNRRIGPDPASLYAAMVGGIIANNASGMCCGTHHNSYHTLKSMIYILPNGCIVDTSIQDYQAYFERTLPDIYAGILQIRNDILSDANLVQLIRRKYSIKNTIGYSLNAFLDFEHPADILRHLMIGSEGTLGFIAEAVLQTVPDKQFKYTGIAYFPDVQSAARVVPKLREAGAEAVELMDFSCLDAMRNEKVAPKEIHGLPHTACALLIEFQEESLPAIEATQARVDELVNTFNTVAQTPFTRDAKQQAMMWKLRKGTLPIVSAFRPSGTTVITEDIAVHPDHLASAVLRLQEIMRIHGYEKSYIFGHAKDGNLHFLFAQSFNSAEDIRRYDSFMQDIAHVIAVEFGGSLKAEHGTGRNMAPFVELEWGHKAYQIMIRLKQLIDPDNLLNPGVILNKDAMAHTKNLKTIPDVEDVINRCIECGFCEHRCPSKDITLTPRQRIVVRRSMERIKKDNYEQYSILKKEYEYYGLETCATDGLCATVCPVNINTGDLVKDLRSLQHNGLSESIATGLADNFAVTQTLAKTGTAIMHALEKTGILNPILSTTRFAFQRKQEILSDFNATDILQKITQTLFGSSLPAWNSYIGKSAPIQKSPSQVSSADIVYFPSCIARMMGRPNHLSDEIPNSIPDVFLRIAERAGIRVHIPDNIEQLCCSMPFSSKGYRIAAQSSANTTIEALWYATEHGAKPIVIDVSSCSYTFQHLKEHLTTDNQQRYASMKFVDAISYIETHLADRLKFSQKRHSVALHPVCSVVKMGLSEQFTALAQRCADDVFIPVNTGCCGFAGDRGLLVPELTASATKEQAEEIRLHSCDGYYSSNPACEAGMSSATEKSYLSYLFLVEEVTR